MKWKVKPIQKGGYFIYFLELATKKRGYGTKKSTVKLKLRTGLINVIAVFAVIVTVALYVVL